VGGLSPQYPSTPEEKSKNSKAQTGGIPSSQNQSYFGLAPINSWFFWVAKIGWSVAFAEEEQRFSLKQFFTIHPHSVWGELIIHEISITSQKLYPSLYLYSTAASLSLFSSHLSLV